MRCRWFGQGAWLLEADAGRVAIDPFGEHDLLPFPRVEIDRADLLLVTHEHRDHSGVEQVGGSPHTIRSTAGTFETPLGEVVAVAAEHDEVAGTRRGPSTIYVLALDGLRLAHFGDFGQRALRPEQRVALGAVDVV